MSQLDGPLLEPELEWERRGDMENVVFVQGAHREGDIVYLTYGAADSCVALAYARADELLAYVKANSELVSGDESEYRG